MRIMSFTELQIRTAVADALDFVVTGAGQSLGVEPQDGQYRNVLADYPDTARIVGYPTEPSPAEPNEVLVDSLSELALALRVLSTMIEPPLTTPQIRSHLEHERAHSGAAKAAGFMGLIYGLALIMPPGRAPTWNVFHAYHNPVEPPTKLALAAVRAAPLVPSPRDIMRVQELGYEDVYDVARRIDAYNALGNVRSLPLPLSYVRGIDQLAG